MEKKRRCVSLYNISKAFDRILHEDLPLRFEAAGISGNILIWFRSYQTGKSTVLPGFQSNRNNIHSGVSRFLLFINYSVIYIRSNIRLFADDTTIYIIVEDPLNVAQILNQDIY